MLAQYLFAINGAQPSAWELKGVAVAGYTVAVLRKSNNAPLASLLILLSALFSHKVLLLALEWDWHGEAAYSPVHLHYWPCRSWWSYACRRSGRQLLPTFQGQHHTIRGHDSLVQDHLLLCRVREFLQRDQRDQGTYTLSGTGSRVCILTYLLEPYQDNQEERLYCITPSHCPLHTGQRCILCRR